MKSENVLNREQAVQQVTSGKQYDLVFTDYGIPITKGHDATKAIKELQAPTNSSRNITCSLHRTCPTRLHGRMHEGLHGLSSIQANKKKPVNDFFNQLGTSHQEHKALNG